MRLAPLIALLGLAACQGIPPAGSYSEVILHAEGEWAVRVRALLEEERDYVVASEALFRVVETGEHESAKNVVLCAPLDEATALSSAVEAALGIDDAARVRGDGAGILIRPDTPSAGQYTFVIAATNAAALRRFLDEDGARVTEVIDGEARARMRQSLSTRPNAEVEADVRLRWGFAIAVPASYSAANPGGDPPGVELLRDGPTRVLGVFRRPWPHAPTVSECNALFDIRQAYVRRRYEGDRMNRERARCVDARLGHAECVTLSGYWYNDRRRPAGGYFETHFLWDPRTQLLWAVDLLVYAPGREKTTLVRELRALAETFRLPQAVGTLGAPPRGSP